MDLSDEERAFIEREQRAAMITLAPDGTPKVARVAISLVDGRVWSSGTRDRVRTKRLRRDPRCTLFVFDSGFSWLALETSVTMLEGPDAAALNLRLFRHMQRKDSGSVTWYGNELDEETFLATMVDEGRLVYQFEVHRSYGTH